MENWDARQFQQQTGTQDSTEQNRNVVEFEPRRLLRDSVHELINLTTSSTLTTNDLQHLLHLKQSTFGNHFIIHLIRALLHTDEDEREAIVWLLTQCNDREAIAPLQQIAQNEHVPRPVRLSASLALAGMGATPEMMGAKRSKRLYAIS